nr:cysteine peptidase family C39 domain-containing protein [uncultured Duganella sp.]
MYYQQVEVSECGLVCLAYAASRLGAHHDLAELHRRFLISNRGLNFQQISEIAASLQMLARGVKCELDEIVNLPVPSILHWGLNHFVVLKPLPMYLNPRNYTFYGMTKNWKKRNSKS